MIKVSIKNDRKLITVNGHSGYDVIGKDIVCASVSATVLTTINAINEFSKNLIKTNQDEAFIEILVINGSKEVDILINNMISCLKQIEKQYKKYINIEEV